MFFIRKACKFGLYIPLSNIILVYGGKYLPDRLLKNISNKRNQKIQKCIVEIVGEKEINNISSNVSSPVFEPGKIWFCWMQGEECLPEIPRLCLDSLRKHANGHEVIVLDNENYKQYVSISARVIQLYESKKLKPAHFADILRVNLLAQQGGLWVDATLLAIKNLPEDIFNRPFFSIKTQEIGHYVSRCRWAVFCLAGEKNNILFQKVASLFNIYLSHTDLFVDYFMFDQFIDILCRHNQEIRKMIDDVPINNIHTHDLSPILIQPFDRSKFQQLTRDTYLFKLSWRLYSEAELTENKDNYYHFLLQSL